MCFLMLTRHSAATAGKCRLQGELWESWGMICNDASHGHADKLEVGQDYGLNHCICVSALVE